MDTIMRYFDLNQPLPEGGGAAVKPMVDLGKIPAIPPVVISLAWQVGIYFAVILGILASHFMDAYRAGKDFTITLPLLVFALIVGIVVFPAAYKSAQLQQSQPTLVQLALVFTSGMGYQALFATAIKAVGGGA